MKKLIIFSFLFLSFYFVKGQKNAPAFHYETKDFDAAIFPKEFARKLWDDTTVELRFTPSISDILTTNKALTEYVLNRAKDTLIKETSGSYYRDEELTELVKDIHRYNWQFWGYINSKGEKLLSVNCFFIDEDVKSEWLIDEIIVMDGGCAYWHALYNLDTGKIIFFSCNGEA